MISIEELQESFKSEYDLDYLASVLAYSMNGKESINMLVEFHRQADSYTKLKFTEALSILMKRFDHEKNLDFKKLQSLIEQ